MKEILVVANRTLGGATLLEAVRERAAEPGGARFRLVVPQSKPSAGLVIYDEAVRESAQVRVDLALSTVAGEGIEATGEVGDADPFLATMDAVAERRPDEIIISTHPATQSGWLRRDLVERIQNASGLPVEHVIVDLEQRGPAVQGRRSWSPTRPPAARSCIEHLRAKADARRASTCSSPSCPSRRRHRRRSRARRARGWRDARPPARGRAAQLGDDRRPRPLHGRDERARAVHGRRRRDLDAARRALRLAALEPDRAGAQRHLVPVEHVVVDRGAAQTAAPAA